MKAPKDRTFEAGEDSGGERGVHEISEGGPRGCYAPVAASQGRRPAARHDFRDAERQNVAGVAGPSHARGQPASAKLGAAMDA
jgi:hypothetical protein